ncbi:MAG: hypothetical protein K6C34_04740 [Alphaproteobacteria bacterium]|nr:hypothetical protein [Alphaproteobacteria bacterium]
MDRYGTKEVLKFSLPLILSSLSMNVMVCMDRLVLTKYSIDAMNAATLGGLAVSLVTFILISVCQISSVFVGQYNGKGEFEKTAQPTWQMIHLSFMSFLIFIPLSMITEYICLIPDYFRADGIPYQKILMAFAPIQAMFAALCAFFIGRKKSNIIITTVLIGNFLNLTLDVLFVFGYGGIIPPMGAIGAASATVTSSFVQVLILGSAFFSKNNRKMYGTSNKSFQKKLFFHCMKIGVPFSFGKFLNMVAWYVMIMFFSHTSKELSTVVSAEFMLFLLFVFVANGCEASISSLASNLIGENNLEGIKRLFKLFMKFNVVAAIIFAIPLLFWHDCLYYLIDYSSEELLPLKSEFEFIIYSLWFTVIADNFFYTVSGILTAGGDTKYPMYLEIIAAWFGATIPTAIMYYMSCLTSVKEVYTLIPVSCFLNCFLIYRRYASFVWFKKLV